MAAHDTLVMTLLNLGSDRLSYYDRTSYRIIWERGNHIITCELLTFLFFVNMNVYESDKRLLELREDSIILNMTIASCVFWFVKVVLFYTLESVYYRKAERADLEMERSFR